MTRKSSSKRRNPISSTRPRQKVSILAAGGKRSRREISTAVAFSGLMTISMPMFRFKSLSPVLYSGLRMRAIAYLAPKCLAVRQHTILISSELVAATSRSASGAPASIRVAAEIPFPFTLIISRASAARRRVSSRRSTMTTSYFSRTSCSAREKPTLPFPTITIFKASDLSSFLLSFAGPSAGQMVHWLWIRPTSRHCPSRGVNTSLREHQSSPPKSGSSSG